jgi:TatD DNase family protein
MHIVDTHCHLNDQAFAGEVNGAIERANSAGVRIMVNVGFDYPSSLSCVKQAQAGLYAAVGCHPEAADMYSEIPEFKWTELAQRPRVVAIGEIGLDYYHDRPSADKQVPVFRAQLELAKQLSLPVIVHSRDAAPDTLEILRQAGPLPAGGVMHCYSGSAEMVPDLAALGFYFGFGGVITFKNAEKPVRALKAVPPDRWVLETDSPYMAPVPFRGKRNEPAYTYQVAMRAAEILGLTIEEVANITTANARRLFRLPLEG